MANNTHEELISDAIPLAREMDVVESMAIFDALPKPFREYLSNYPYLIHIEYNDNLKELIDIYGIEDLLEEARLEDEKLIRESAELAYGPEHPEAKPKPKFVFDFNRFVNF